MNELRRKLENKESHFTPYLGISEFIAKIRYVGCFKTKKVESKNVEIDSTVAMFKNVKIKLDEGKKLYRETQTLIMDKERHSQGYIDIFYESDGKKISILKSDEKIKIVEFELNSVKERVMLF